MGNDLPELMRSSDKDIAYMKLLQVGEKEFEKIIAIFKESIEQVAKVLNDSNKA